MALSREKLAEGQGGPFAAIVVRDGEVIAEGWNQVTGTNDPTAHAEMVAIRAACRTLDTFSLEGSTIYVNCEPCPMCLAAMYWARIERVVYANTRQDAARIGFDDERIYREVALQPGDRELPSERVPSEDALDVFREWLEKDDRIQY